MTMISFHSTIDVSFVTTRSRDSRMEFTKIKIKNFFNLNNVELDLNKGNTLIVGPNGSGKTNITKCVQFLVNGVLEDYIGRVPAAQSEESQEIWKSYKKCCVEIHGRFIKGGLELFSRLRAVCLMAELCNFVCAVLGFLGERDQAYEKQEKKEDNRADGYEIDPSPDVNVDREEDLLQSLPEKIKRTVSRMPVKLDVKAMQDCEDLCKVVDDLVERVFPKLIKITESHLPEGLIDRAEDRHVTIAARTQDSGKLGFSINM